MLSAEDERLLARASSFDAPHRTLETLTPPRLAALGRTVGLDLATAILYDRVSRVPTHAAFGRCVSTVEATATLDADLIGVVPGAFHREHRHTGADGARVIAIAQQMGCEARVIPTASFGGLDQGARTIVEWLRMHRRRRIVLLSLSKGGAEVKRALSLPEAADTFADVSAWISLSGMVAGTPLVDWLRRRWLRWSGVRAWLWWKGHGMQAMTDLRRAPDEPPASGWPGVPPHLRMVHVYGCPLQRHLVHPWATRAYARLSPLGPNDGGGILLSDLAGLPGIVYPVWGVDHYLTPRWDIVPLLRRIILAAVNGKVPPF